MPGRYISSSIVALAVAALAGWRLIPEVVSFAQDEVGARVEGRADFAEAAVAAAALEIIFVPVHVQRL